MSSIPPDNAVSPDTKLSDKIPLRPQRPSPGFAHARFPPRIDVNVCHTVRFITEHLRQPIKTLLLKFKREVAVRVNLIVMKGTLLSSNGRGGK
jgi:hypothetical protein